MKKSTVFALLVVVSLVCAVVSSYCMAVYTSSEALFGILSVVCACAFTLFVNKLTNALA